ncbi:MAG: response regulator transcription factor [Chitinophagaceae bacterium]|nr:response regulator transcription factor [Chitinophagaceae bacterium]
MEKLTCYLVDDEISAVENLQAMLASHWPSAEVLGYSHTVEKAISFLSAHKPDVLFLDIRMQNETGFDLMRQLPDFEGSLIFVTAYDEYGLQAIKFSATDYLLKPINTHELVAALQKVSKKKKASQTHEQINMLLQSFENQKRSQQKKIALPDADEIRYVNIADIVCCRSNNSYTTFYINGSVKATVSKPISEYEELLQSYDFIRVHQSWLVNKNKIRSYRKEDGGSLYMEDGTIIPVSRQRKHLLREW